MKKWEEEMTTAGVSPTEMAPFKGKEKQRVYEQLLESAPDLGTYIKLGSDEILPPDDKDMNSDDELKWLREQTGFYREPYMFGRSLEKDQEHLSTNYEYINKEGGVSVFEVDSRNILPYRDFNEKLKFIAQERQKEEADMPRLISEGKWKEIPIKGAGKGGPTEFDTRWGRSLDNLERDFKRRIKSDMEKLGFKSAPKDKEEKFDSAFYRADMAATRRRWRLAREYREKEGGKKKEFDF